jgi:hypothetical protein
LLFKGVYGVESSFTKFHKRYFDIWQTGSLSQMKEIISQEYQAREVTDGKVIDFGYEESIRGWEQGFKFVLDNNAKWDIKEISRVCLGDHQIMSILTVTLNIAGKPLETGNLFFQTFSYDFSWKLVRSYIES